MVILTVARRLCIFAVFIGLVLNGVFLVMASQAGAARTDQNEATFKLRVRLKDKAAADELAASIKKEKADLAPKATVSSAKVVEETPTGKFTVAIVMPADSAGSVANMLKTSGYVVVVENAEPDRKRIRLNESFNSKSEAQARVQAVSEKTSGLVKMDAVEGRAKKPSTAWYVEVTVSDEAAFDGVRAYVETKAPAAPIEP